MNRLITLGRSIFSLRSSRQAQFPIPRSLTSFTTFALSPSGWRCLGHLAGRRRNVALHLNSFAQVIHLLQRLRLLRLRRGRKLRLTQHRLSSSSDRLCHPRGHLRRAAVAISSRDPKVSPIPYIRLQVLCTRCSLQNSHLRNVAGLRMPSLRFASKSMRREESRIRRPGQENDPRCLEEQRIHRPVLHA